MTDTVTALERISLLRGTSNANTDYTQGLYLPMSALAIDSSGRNSTVLGAHQRHSTRHSRVEPSSPSPSTSEAPFPTGGGSGAWQLGLEPMLSQQSGDTMVRL